MTNPEPSVTLRSDDLVTVLAPAQFGQHCFEQDLLIGAHGAPSRLDLENKLIALSEEGPKEARTVTEVPVAPTQSGAEVIIPLEDPLPLLPNLHQDRASLPDLQE